MTVTASTIQELVDNPDVATWVERGLPLHAEGQKHCYFCKQELAAARLHALDAHFNDQFKAQQRRLAKLLSEVNSFRGSVHRQELPERSALYSHLQTEYGEQLVKLKQHEFLVEEYLKGLASAIEAKKDEPFAVLDLSAFMNKLDIDKDSTFWTLVNLFLRGATAVSANFGVQAMQSILRLVREHNDFTDNFEKSAAAARKTLEFDEGVKVFEEWMRRRESVKLLTAAHAEMQEKLQPIAGQIAQLQRAIRQHHLAAEELTRELAAYLGRDELRFDAKDDGYTVLRGKLPAMHLSDGERTAIAFMYFLKTLRDSDFKL